MDDGEACQELNCLPGLCRRKPADVPLNMDGASFCGNLGAVYSGRPGRSRALNCCLADLGLASLRSLEQLTHKLGQFIHFGLELA